MPHLNQEGFPVAPGLGYERYATQGGESAVDHGTTGLRGGCHGGAHRRQDHVLFSNTLTNKERRIKSNVHAVPTFFHRCFPPPSA
jgi:hypothetical protein